MIEILKINSEEYPNGKKYIFSYRSNKYYDVLVNDIDGWSISLKLKDFEKEFNKVEEIEIFDDYKTDLKVYVAKIDNIEAGIISFAFQKWNNTLIVHDLYVDENFKRRKIGKTLMDLAIKKAKESGIRSVVLETQTCNYPAISFYLKSGFKFAGINISGYSNNDIKNKDVRIEMAYLL